MRGKRTTHTVPWRDPGQGPARPAGRGCNVVRAQDPATGEVYDTQAPLYTEETYTRSASGDVLTCTLQATVAYTSQ